METSIKDSSKIKIKIKAKPKKRGKKKGQTKKIYRKYDSLTKENLRDQYDKYIKELDKETPEYNNFLRNKERLETDNLVGLELSKDTEYGEIIDQNILYPSLNDPEFNKKLVLKKEFLDTKQDLQIEPVQEKSDILCNSEFELAPHQMFVRNFLSFQTPYNGLLLFHGLGTGKTCSAISVCEDTKDNAPTIVFSPITASSIMTAFIPIKQFFFSVAPCIIAP